MKIDLAIEELLKLSFENLKAENCRRGNFGENLFCKLSRQLLTFSSHLYIKVLVMVTPIELQSIWYLINPFYSPF